MLCVLFCHPLSAYAGEAEVEASLAALRAQTETLHQRTLTLIDDMNRAWDDLQRDPTPAKEMRLNKLKDDYERTTALSREQWKWIGILGEQRSTTVNFIRELLGQTQQTLDSAAELARGAIPGATYVLGVSRETLFNERWKETEAAFGALMEKGRELRQRHREITANIRDRLKDTPENREELKKLEEEIAVWKAKTETMSEIYEFLRSDMPAEVVFWNELAGPYVQALYDNVKNNLEEIILWDTLGGTSPAERLYKLFKPALQLKLGETFFSDPVLTDKIRNTLVMEVLFGGADLDRIQKSAELGMGKILDSAGVQKAAAELLGSPARRAELQGILQQMSYDRIPAKTQAMLAKMGEKVPQPPAGTLERFVASGLTADEIKRLNKIKDSKEMADGIMKVANEFIGPALNWSAFSTAYEATRQECATYRAAYKQLRAARIVGAGTFTGVGGTVAASAEDNFVNACFDDPSLFAGYLERLKTTYRGVDVEKFAIRETFRKKKVEPVNDKAATAGTPDGGGDYGTWGNKLGQLFRDLWDNAVAPESVQPLIAEYTSGLNKVFQEHISRIVAGQPPSCSDYAGVWGIRGVDDCPAGVKAAIDREKESSKAEAGKFHTPFYEKAGQEMPWLARTLAPIIKRRKIDKTYLTFPDDKVVEPAVEKDGLDVMAGADEAHKWFWWGGWSGRNTPAQSQEYLRGLMAEPAVTLDTAAQTFDASAQRIEKAIAGLTSYLNTKKAEKDAVLDMGGVLERVAERVAERRNFLMVAQAMGGGWNPADTEEWHAAHVPIDDFIARHGGFTTVFTRLYEAETARYRELLNRLQEHHTKVRRAADAARGIPTLLADLDRYAAEIGKLADGYYTLQQTISSTISSLFGHGIATTREGGTFLELLAAELRPDKITTRQQLDFLLSPEADRKFPQFFEVKGISHPVLRDFVTPDEKRLEKARGILESSSLETEGLLAAYADAERSAGTIQSSLEKQMARLRAGVREAAPSFADSIGWELLEGRKTVAGYNNWLSLPKPVAEFPRLPEALWQDLRAQERGISAYRAFLRELRLKPPTVQDREIVEAVTKLEGIYEKVKREENDWLDYDPARFSAAFNDVNGTAHGIYEQMYTKGKAPTGGPVATAYLKILGETNRINTIRIERTRVAELARTLSGHLTDVDAFLKSFESASSPVGQEQIQSWTTMLETDIQPGSPADELKSHSTIAPLIEQIRARIATLRSLKPVANDRGPELVRDLYRQFAEAYQARDASRLMAFMGDDWEAGDGTTLADMQANLSRMFRRFDEVRFDIQNLKIDFTPQGYVVSYDVTISSRIYSRNLRHQEKSAVNELVALGNDGKPRIIKTLGGRYWLVE
uniref:Nuclear transport factor 2 family protein n=1 Tax=Geobacter metallireducens TaxID=28232 RepID=A0A831XLJ7_GEOME